MNQYAVALSDLDTAWRTPAGSAVLEAALEGDEDPQTVTAERGVEAAVVAGPEEIAESVAIGLLSFDLPLTPPRRARVYARGEGERGWTRLWHAAEVPYAPLEQDDVDLGSPRIDAELLELAAPMDDATREALRASLRSEGCRDALIVWDEQDVLLDGHNRLALCREHGIPFEIKRVSFPDRAAALEWFVAAQRSRRSLSPSWATYYLGRQYNATKQDKSDNLRRGDASPKGQSAPSGRASAPIAQAAGIDEKTVRRAAAFAEAIDRLELVVPHARRAVLNGELRLSRRQIDQALDVRATSFRELRELTESAERDYLADVLRAARKLRDALDAYRLRGTRPEDRDHAALTKPATREVLEELPLLVGAFRSDVGLGAEMADPAGAQAAAAGA